MEFTLLFVSAFLFIVLSHGQAQLCPAAFGDFPEGNGCVTFVRCWRGQAFPMQCPANTAFDPITRRCSNNLQVACVQNNQVAGPLIGGNGRAAAAAIGQLQQPAINQVQFAGFPGQTGGFVVPGAGAGAGVGVNPAIGARGGSNGAAGVNGNVGANVGAGIGNQPQLLPAGNPAQFPAWLQPQQAVNPFLLPAANPAPLAGGNAVVQPLQPQNAGNALLLPNGNVNGGGFLNFPVGQGQPRGGQAQIGGGAAQAGNNGVAGRGQNGIVNPAAGAAGGAQGQGQGGGVGLVPLFTVNQSQTAKINQNQSVGAAPGK